MSRARYSFTDAEGNTQGLMTFSQLKDCEIEGKIKPDTVITDFSKIVERRADSIPGIFSLGGPSIGTNPANWDKSVGLAITLLGVWNACLTIYLMVEYYAFRGSDAQAAALFSMRNYPISGWLIVFLEIAAIMVAAQWVGQSKRIGFGIVVAVDLIGLMAPRASGSEYGFSPIVQNLWYLAYFGTLACFVYCFLRLTGCYGEAPEA